MRILVAFLVLAGLVLSATAADAKKRKRHHRHVAPEPYVEKHASIVIDAATGHVLYERMSTEERYPASLTKMMTLYLLFEQLQQGRISLSTTLTASAYACSQEPTKLGLKPGDQVSVEDAVKALVVRSANDVAVMVAEHLGGNEYAFAGRMTAKAREMGMSHTTFVNASGLPDKSQITTATDLVVLSRRLIMDFPQFYPYFRAQSFVWNGRSFEGHNNLMKFYDGADGLKTGYTRMSGFNLASSAVRQGRRLIAVVMGGRTARDRDTRTAELLESEFSKLGLGRPAPVIMAMSPLVLDDEEAAAAEEAERASAFRPDAQPVATPVIVPAATPPADSSTQLRLPAPIYAGLGPNVREDGEGDTEEVVRSTPPVMHGKWGIQVGAHASREKAETQLAQVQKLMKDILGKAESAIVQLDVRGETFYRVRFGAFTPKKAEALCEQLQKRGTSCLVVTDGAWDQATTRATLPIAVR